MADSQYEIYRVLSNHFVDTLKGLETLKYLGKSEQHEGKIEKVSKRYRKATMRTLRVAFLSSCIRFLYEFINCVCGSWIRDTFNRWNDYTITSPYNFDFSSGIFSAD